MANTQLPGFQPLRLNAVGGTITYIRRRALSNPTNEISCFDAVKRTSSGDIQGLGTSSTFATAVESVAVGVSYLDANSQRIGAKKLPASTTYSGTSVDPYDAIYVWAVENPVDTVFMTSTDGTNSDISLLGENYSINLAAGVNGFSQQSANSASHATTNTLPIRHHAFVDNVASDPTLANAWIEVLLNRGLDFPALTDGTGT